MSLDVDAMVRSGSMENAECILCGKLRRYLQAGRHQVQVRRREVAGAAGAWTRLAV